MIHLSNSSTRFVAVLLFFAALVADAQTEPGVDSIGKLDFTRAASQFKIAMEACESGTPEWEKAALGYALALHRRQPDSRDDKGKATEIYTQVIAGNSGSVFHQLALVYRGKMAERVDYFGDTPDIAEAVRHYSQLLSQFPESALAPYAALYRAQAKVFTMQRDQVEQALNELEGWLRDNPNNPAAALHWLLIADARYYPMKDFKAALTALVKAEQAGLPLSILKDQFWWKTARMAVLAGADRLAKTYIRKILDLDASGFIASAKDLLLELNDVERESAETHQ